MEITHYTLDASNRLGNSLHLYEFPFSSNCKGYMHNRVNPVSGPATVFISPSGKVTVMTTQVLSRKNFEDHRIRGIIDRIKIVEYEQYGQELDFRDIELSLLGRCDVKTCLEPALFEGSTPVITGNIDSYEGHTRYACSAEHMEELIGSTFSDKRKPLEELKRNGKVKITVD